MWLSLGLLAPVRTCLSDGLSSVCVHLAVCLPLRASACLPASVNFSGCRSFCCGLKSVSLACVSGRDLLSLVSELHACGLRPPQQRQQQQQQKRVSTDARGQRDTAEGSPLMERETDAAAAAATEADTRPPSAAFYLPPRFSWKLGSLLKTEIEAYGINMHLLAQHAVALVSCAEASLTLVYLCAL